MAAPLEAVDRVLHPSHTHKRLTAIAGMVSHPARNFIPVSPAIEIRMIFDHMNHPRVMKPRPALRTTMTEAVRKAETIVMIAVIVAKAATDMTTNEDVGVGATEGAIPDEKGVANRDVTEVVTVDVARDETVVANRGVMVVTNRGVMVVANRGVTEVVTVDVARDEILAAPAIPIQILATEMSAVTDVKTATIDVLVIIGKIGLTEAVEMTAAADVAEAAKRRIGRREESVFTRINRHTCRNMILERPNSMA